MEPLTKQDFEQAVKDLATKEDLAALATKADLGETEARLKLHAEDLQADLAGMIDSQIVPTCSLPVTCYPSLPRVPI